MEMLGGKDDENTEAQRMAERSLCVYRNLNDETKVAEFFGQYPEDLEEDSAQAEEMMGRPICGSPSCLLNLRIMLGHVLSPDKPEAISRMWIGQCRQAVNGVGGTGIRFKRNYRF